MSDATSSPTVVPRPLSVQEPVRFAVCGKPMPDGTLSLRYLFARGVGTERNNALFAATHDRAAGLVAQLSRLIERSGDAGLVEIASQLVAGWNYEAETFLSTDGYGR